MCFPRAASEVAPILRLWLLPLAQLMVQVAPNRVDVDEFQLVGRATQ